MIFPLTSVFWDNKFFHTLELRTGKIPYVAYNENSGDKCFRSLLTPHSARTYVRAVPSRKCSRMFVIASFYLDWAMKSSQALYFINWNLHNSYRVL